MEVGEIDASRLVQIRRSVVGGVAGAGVPRIGQHDQIAAIDTVRREQVAVEVHVAVHASGRRVAGIRRARVAVVAIGGGPGDAGGESVAGVADRAGIAVVA